MYTHIFMFFTQNIGYNSQRPYTCPTGHIIWIFSLGILNLGLGLFVLEGFWHAGANGFCLESPEMESSWCKMDLKPILVLLPYRAKQG